jgi:uncharacterized protein (TIGR03435 family)
MRFVVLAGLAFAWAVAAQTFDAASVKIAGPEVQQPYINSGGPGTNDPGRWRAPHIDMSWLLTLAFDVSVDQIVGPAWVRDFGSRTYYTVLATLPPDTGKEQFRKMLQNLLIERFHLKSHLETRDFPGYELVVDKGGPKLKEVSQTENPADLSDGDLVALMHSGSGDDGFPKLPPGPRTMSQSARGLTRTKYQERTMAEFASGLGYTIGSSQGKGASDGNLQPRVVDKTGLTGKYTFILEYFDAGMANLSRMLRRPDGDPGLGAAAPPAASDPDGGGPTIFKAVQKLGLRLDKVAAVSMQVIVIENLDKTPTEN